MVDLRTETREPEMLAERHVHAVATRLAEEFGATTDDMEGRVRSEFSRWQDARVKAFVPVFVERRLREQLRHA
jgi:hypothetical protein